MFIISDDSELWRTYEYEKKADKVKSSKNAKQFAKENIKCNRRKYDNSSKFYTEYFENDINLLVYSIKEYKRLRGAHKKDEKQSPVATPFTLWYHSYILLKKYDTH